MAVVYSALRSELLSDPGSFGYAGILSGGNYNGLVGTLNSVSANAGKSVASTIDRSLVNALQMQQCVVVTEYASLATVSRDLWNAIITTATAGIAISNTVIRAQVLGIWSAGTTTRTNLGDLQVRAASRCEVLFGENTSVDASMVTYAIEGVV